ncbi:MAG: nucleotidyltransferase domain-containing protein [Anaerolineae bacterium]
MERQNDIRTERQRRAAEIITQLVACAADVLANYPVEIAYLHGSVARGCPLPASDVDIALVLSQVPESYQRLRLELEIQAALEDACRLSNLDVRAINQAPLRVQGSIVQAGVLLYSRDKKRRVAYEVLTRKRYFDFQPRARRLQQAFFDRIQREGLSGGQSRYRRVHSKPA